MWTTEEILAHLQKVRSEEDWVSLLSGEWQPWAFRQLYAQRLQRRGLDIALLGTYFRIGGEVRRFLNQTGSLKLHRKWFCSHYDFIVDVPGRRIQDHYDEVFETSSKSFQLDTSFIGSNYSPRGKEKIRTMLKSDKDIRQFRKLKGDGKLEGIFEVLVPPLESSNGRWARSRRKLLKKIKEKGKIPFFLTPIYHFEDAKLILVPRS
ncbi:hypothetical protein GF420_15815 [candidate division GN15 bacterium]|nr:hypothetical protein [candidate division GN15 bacterium]